MSSSARLVRSALLLALGLCLGSPLAGADPLARDEVPQPLEPWIDWVLRGHEASTCPFQSGEGSRHCVWPSRLELELGAEGGRFVHEVEVDHRSQVTLPGGDGAPSIWPEKVRVGIQAAAALRVGGRPRIELGPGRHRIEGSFRWNELPPSLRLPPHTGLLTVRLGGARIEQPRIDAEGRLWLRRSGPATGGSAERETATVEVHRLAVDDVPMRLDTRVALQVSGRARELQLGRALPEGFVPTGIESPLPARLDGDGRLRVQVRPGRFVLRLRARHVGRPESLRAPEQPSPDAVWDESEVWSFEAQPALRLVELSGAPRVDPGQTEVPEAWKRFPSFRMDAAADAGAQASLTLREKRRGNEGGAADRLSLERTWHLDFDGGAATVSDKITGTLHHSTRLEMAPETELGRASVGGVDQPITQLASDGARGVEVPLGAIELLADSRAQSATELSAVGWAHDFDSVEGTLELPPGWKLLHASGVDRASTSWVSRWTLLDVFVVMIVAMATLRLYGPAAGGIALLALALTYTESAAPRTIWLAVLILEALCRVVPEGRFASGLRIGRGASLALLCLIALNFGIEQVRIGLHPALERPWHRASAPAPAAPELDAEESGRLGALGYVEGEAMSEDAPRSAPERKRPASGLLRSSFQYAPDPETSVPTGPGRPDWNWERVHLRWSGPVEAGQPLRLWLVAPWMNAVLSLLRTALVAAGVLLLLGIGRAGGIAGLPFSGAGSGAGGSSAPAPRAGSTPRGSAAALGLAIAAFVSLAPAELRADPTPRPEILNELRSRLLEPPRCFPACARISRVALRVSEAQLELVFDVEAAADTAVPLPGAGDGGFDVRRVEVDGRTAPALRRERDALWVQVKAGRHRLRWIARLAPRPSLELPLPMVPDRGEMAPPEGWVVSGIFPDGRVAGALQLSRKDDPGALASAPKLEASAVPPFLRIERTLQLGLRWELRSRAIRVAPESGALVVSVPLLPGESVTTPGVRVEDGQVRVSLEPGSKGMSWESILPQSETIELSAPEDAPWNETWRIDASPLWHVSAEGLPAVDRLSPGRRLREWRPWPGESLRLRVERPGGLGADTLTIDRAEMRVSPGLRATDVSLGLTLRSSQGGRHRVRLPEAATLTEMRIDGEVQPLRQEGLEVPIPVRPGAQQVVLRWRDTRGISLVTSSPELDLGIPAVNLHLETAVPEGRWLLYAGGPRLGPAILVWPFLLLLGVVSFGLGRIPWTPLRARHWFGLSIGLTQAPLWALGVVVGWLLALAWREKRAEELAIRLRAGTFDLLQVALAGLSLFALVCLLTAIENGLLGSPQMKVLGNGSQADLLRWYQDRSDGALPETWILSTSIWVYRAVMLGWSLWIAQALIGWLRWGWAAFSSEGLWRPLRSPEDDHEPLIPQERDAVWPGETQPDPD